MMLHLLSWGKEFPTVSINCRGTERSEGAPGTEKKRGCQPSWKGLATGKTNQVPKGVNFFNFSLPTSKSQLLNRQLLPTQVQFLVGGGDGGERGGGDGGEREGGKRGGKCEARGKGERQGVRGAGEVKG